MAPPFVEKSLRPVKTAKYGRGFKAWRIGTGLAENKAGWRAVTRNDKQQTTKNMNTLTFKGDWNIAKGKLKKQYAQLTDDDLKYIEGSEDELIGRIQKRTGQAKDAVERAVRESLEYHNK